MYAHALACIRKINVSCGLRVALKLSEREGLHLVICLVWY